MHQASVGRQPGQYWPALLEDNRRSAIFYCPICGQGMDLRNHTITNGVVTPSVVEPLDPFPAKCPRCGKFHEHLILLDW